MMADAVMRLLLLTTACLSGTLASVYDLSEDNFDRLVFRPSNKAVFVKFYVRAHP